MVSPGDLKVLLNPAAAGDLGFLRRMLFEAFFWRPDQPRPDYAEFAQTNLEFQKLLKGWGRPGDAGIIAKINNQPIGAAWYRLWTAQVHSYGYIDPKTPEIGIGVRSENRRQGIGKSLLRALLDTAAVQGFAQISLSVEPDNPALRLYTSQGFLKVGRVDGSWTMVRRFSDKPR
jgi:ribosomal protein S18 acetylase RimI-like enzyme